MRDNVTVVVAAYGRKSSLTLKLLAYLLLASAAAGLIILLSGLGLLQFLQPILLPPDLGVAFLLEGNAEQVGPLYRIYPGTDLNAAPDSPIHISFKERVSLDSEISQTIPGIDLYFGPGTAFNLAAIDVQGFTDPARGIKEPVDLAEVTLTDGQALLLSRQDYTFYVWLGTRENARTPYAVMQGNPAALGVERRGSQADVTCLAGSCSIHIGKRFTLVPAGSTASFPLDGPGDPSFSFTTAGPVEHEKWLSLCRTWETDPEIMPEACGLLIPQP